MKIKGIVKNAFVGEVCTIIMLILRFFVRTAFIHYLSVSYLGVNEMIFRIISILSICDLGFSSAIQYSMYRPAVNGDIHKLKSFYDLFRKVFVGICIAITTIGLVLIPFISSFSNQAEDVRNLGVLLFILIVEMNIHYIFLNNRSVFVVLQKQYVYTAIETVVGVFQCLLQIVVLIIYKNYTVYLLIKLAGTIVTVIITHMFVQKNFFKDQKIQPSTLTNLEKTEIKINVKSNIIAQLGYTLTDNMDAILIFVFGGLKRIGVYANYSLIVNTVQHIFHPIFNSIFGNIGHLCKTMDKSDLRKAFESMNLAAFWCYGFGSVSLICLMNPFIYLWAGNEYLFNMPIAILQVIIFYILGMRSIVSLFRDALGLFRHYKYRMLIESLINLIISTVLMISIGEAGLFIGTIVSNIAVTMWLNPYNLYHTGFKVSVKGYYIQFIKYTFILIATTALTYFVCSILPFSGLLNFALKMCVCIVIPNGLFYILFYKTSEFQYIFAQIKLLFSSINLKKR